MVALMIVQLRTVPMSWRLDQNVLYVKLLNVVYKTALAAHSTQEQRITVWRSTDVTAIGAQENVRIYVACLDLCERFDARLCPHSTKMLTACRRAEYKYILEADLSLIQTWLSGALFVAGVAKAKEHLPPALSAQRRCP